MESAPMITKISLPSPIRKLPSELLVEIFAICRFSYSPAFDEVSGSRGDTDTTFEVEIQRLAQAPLLRASQVCSRWHQIAIGTTTLWGTIELDSVLCDTPAHAEIALGLLRCVLERGGNSSLDLSISDRSGTPDFLPLLEPIAQNAERFRSLEIFSRLPSITALSGIFGRLPHLENLRVEIHEFESEALNFLEVVPSLKRFTFLGPPSAISKLLVRQLDYFAWLAVVVDEAPAIMSALQSMKEGSVFELELDIMLDPLELVVLNIPPITSHVSALGITFIDYFHFPHAHQALAELFDNLTLPGLEELNFHTEQYPSRCLSWPHAQFLDLSARSAFNSQLRCLSLYHVVITDAELRACLAVLPCLEELAISDHEAPTDNDGGGVNHLLITTALLDALIRTEDASCLVPQLRTFDMQSLLQFDDIVYFHLIYSRLSAEYCFASSIWWIPGHEREMHPEVLQNIGAMCAEGILEFEFLSAEPPNAEEAPAVEETATEAESQE
ncbi:hypothetical protein C8R43DRAFT_1233737 [Mycena crocata]|nr:hypothetical protein C8R43DRAFT_1233737 [Mycena crocata]